MGAEVALGFMAAVSLLAFVATMLQSRPLRGGVTTTGTVVDATPQRSRLYSQGPDRRTMTTYAPVVEFTDAIGVIHKVTSSLSGGVRPAAGSVVQVSYLPEQPERARIVKGAGQQRGRYVFLTVGLACLVGAIAVTVH